MSKTKNAVKILHDRYIKDDPKRLKSLKAERRKLRTKPYTEIGISRVPCFRCGEPSAHNWKICALKNEYKGICIKCDVKLNKMVLKFMRVKNWKEIIWQYVRRLK